MGCVVKRLCLLRPASLNHSSQPDARSRELHILFCDRDRAARAYGEGTQERREVLATLALGPPA